MVEEDTSDKLPKICKTVKPKDVPVEIKLEQEDNAKFVREE